MGVKHPFSIDKQSTEDNSFQGFIARNPTISLRKVESTITAHVIHYICCLVQLFLSGARSRFNYTYEEACEEACVSH